MDELEVLVVAHVRPHLEVVAAILNERKAALVQVGTGGVEVRIAALSRVQTAMILAPVENNPANTSL